MAGRRIAMADAFKWYKGELDSEFYVRTLVKDKETVMAVCRKPRYTKDKRKEMAKRPQIKRFNWVIAEAQAIYHDPVRRAKWEKRHQTFQRAARKKGEYTYPRLWDFIRHELNAAKIAAERKG